MNDAEQANNVVFVSLDGLVVSVINSGYQEVALLSVSSVPAVWEVEVNNRWKILNVELQTWLEDQWRNKQGQTNLQEQFEVGIMEKKCLTVGYIGMYCISIIENFIYCISLDIRRSFIPSKTIPKI